MFRRFAQFVLVAVFALQSSLAVAADPKKTNGEKKAPAHRTYVSLVPADGSLINSNKPTISAEYMDEGIGINPAATKIYIDGVDVTAQAQVTVSKVTFTPSQPMTDGPHKVKVDIEDKAGNPAMASWSFNLRTQPPKIKITSHSANQYVNQTPILVTGTVDESKVRVLVNGISAVVDNGKFSAKVNLVDGSNTITAIATDPFSNTGTDSVVVVLDNKPPVIEIKSPAANSLVNTRTVEVSGFIDGRAVKVTLSTSPSSTGPAVADLAQGAFSAKGITLAEGVNTITAKAVSRAGNTGTSSIKVTVDTVPPRVALTAPKDKSITNKKTISVSGTVDDPQAVVRVNNTPVQVSKGMFTLSGVNLAEGSNTITATATDRAGNQAKAATIVVVLKTAPPAPPKISDLPFVVREAPITVKGTAEPGTQVELFMNSVSRGSLKTDAAGAFSFKAVMQEGNNAFSAVATDAVGNVSASSAVVNVFFDKTPPKIL